MMTDKEITRSITELLKLRAYGDRLYDLEQEYKKAESRLGTIQQELAWYQDTQCRREEVLEAVQAIPPLDNRVATKVFLRKIIEAIVVRDGEIEELIIKA
jgi:hypothetical protein